MGQVMADVMESVGGEARQVPLDQAKECLARIDLAVQLRGNRVEREQGLEGLVVKPVRQFINVGERKTGF